MLLAVLSGLVVWVYLDNRKHIKDDISDHKKSAESKFTDLYTRMVDCEKAMMQIPDMKDDIKWIRKRLEAMMESK